MAIIGKINRLPVVRHVDFGLYLDGGEQGEILLPKSEFPKNQDTSVGSEVDAFIYHDSEDRLVASGRRPKVQLGEFAVLQVVDVNRTGIFLDWGLKKDLMMPHSEEKHPLQAGDSVVVYVYQDVHTQRLVASAQLERFAQSDVSEGGYTVNDEVRLLVAESVESGYVCLVDKQYLGLLQHHAAFRPVRVGQTIAGFVQEVRDDGRLSLSTQLQGQQVRDELGEQIMAALDEQGGRLNLSDKSPAQAIADAFGVSKGNYKKAIGGLFKQGLIQIYPDHIRKI